MTAQHRVLQLARIGLIGATGRLGRAVEALAGDSIAARFHRTSPPDPRTEIDVFLDVSAASALRQNLDAAVQGGKPIAVGTTGAIDFNLLEEAARHIAVFYTPNFSLGMAVLKKAAKLVAGKFPGAAIEIVETHHELKKDAPSGSALLLAKHLEPREAAIRSHRIGQTVGKHELIFSASDERIALIHEALSRDAFARGALEAARFVALQSPGLYTMDDLIS